MKRWGFILGWFAWLFVLNVVVWHDPKVADPFADGIVEGVMRMLSPIELIASVVVVGFISTRTGKRVAPSEANGPIIQDK